MAQHMDGVAVSGAYTFSFTPRGSTTPITLVFQKHDYKPGKRDSKEYSVGGEKRKQPMQRGCGTHELESLIPTGQRADWETALDACSTIDTATFPGFNTARGPHFLEEYSFSDDLEGMSSLKVTISETNGAIA